MTGGVPGQICLMQGNEAIVRGAVEAGIHFAASYPGSPSSQVLGMLGKIARERGFYAEWSTNEVCALQACTGASLAGGRALCVVKQNGLLCVADALHCAAQAGVKGGLVIVSSDDPSAHSSTNEFDSRWQAMSAGIPLLEPTTMQEAKDMIPYAFDLSEKVGQIVLIRVTTRVCHGRGNVTLGPLPEKLRPLERVKEWDRMVCVSYMHGPALQKLEKLRGLFEDSPCNHYEGPEAPKKLVIAGGTGRLYGQEALRRLGVDQETGFMALGTLWPLPENYILSYLRTAEEVLILEEVDPFLERAVQALAGREGLSIRFLGRDNALPAVGELDPDVVTAAICRLTGAALPEKKATGELELPVREMSFCAGCPHRATFYLLKRAMRQEKHPGVVVGDIGCYFMAGQSAGQYAWQTCNCMGSGVSVAEGLGQLTNYGLDQKVVTMCGDSTFFHTILPGLVNATYHNANMLLIVLDNSATAMTGFQPHPGHRPYRHGGPGEAHGHPQDSGRRGLQRGSGGPLRGGGGGKDPPPDAGPAGDERSYHAPALRHPHDQGAEQEARPGLRGPGRVHRGRLRLRQVLLPGLGLPRQHLGLQEKQGAHRPRHLRGVRRVRQAVPLRGHQSG